MKQLLVSGDVRAIGGTIFNNNPRFDCTLLKQDFWTWLRYKAESLPSLPANNCRPRREDLNGEVHFLWKVQSYSMKNHLNCSVMNFEVNVVALADFLFQFVASCSLDKYSFYAFAAMTGIPAEGTYGWLDSEMFWQRLWWHVAESSIYSLSGLAERPFHRVVLSN